MVIIMMEPADLEKKAPAGETMPDLIIHEFGQLLDIFPDRHMQRAVS
jgi:hypothetical protein